METGTPRRDEKSDLFQDQVLAILTNLKEDMQSMGNRVANLEDRQAQSAPEPISQVAVLSDNGSIVQSTPWADRDPLEKPDVSLAPTWDEDEEDDPKRGFNLFKVSEKTELFLKQSFTSTVQNPHRRLLKEKFGAPNTPFTACPSVDKFVKSRLPAHAKAKDRSLSKHQALVLDAVGPLSTILEEAAKGTLSVKTATEAAQTALKFLGNASMHMNRERRRIAIEAMNPSLTDLAEDDEAFTKAAPLLFGEGFAKKAKERDEELKCLNKASKHPSFKPGQNPQFFRGSRPQTYSHHGGGHNRGQGRRGNRHHPYPNRPTPKTQQQ